MSGVTGRDASTHHDYAEHAAFEFRSARAAPEHFASQTFLKMVDLRARRTKAGQFDDRALAQIKLSPERQVLQLEAGRRDVFAEIARADDMPGFAQLVEQFGADQVYLSPIGLPRPHPRDKSVANKFASMGITFHAMVLDEGDVWLERLTERVLRVTGNA